MSADQSKKEEKKPNNPGHPNPPSDPNPPGNPNGPGKSETNPRNPNLRDLLFVVNGDDQLVEKVNINEPLRVAAQQALKQAGSTKPLSEYQAVYNDQAISLDKKIKDYQFPADAIVYLNLNRAGGGDR
jgi:hypothetical protein